MLVITVALSLMLVAVVVAVTFGIVMLVNNYKELKDKNVDMKKKLDASEAKNKDLQGKLNSIISTTNLKASYQTKDPVVIAIMGNVQELVRELQTGSSCRAMMQHNVQSKSAFLASLKSGSPSVPKTCAAAKTDFRASIDTYVTSLAASSTANATKELSEDKKKAIREKFYKLSDTIVNASCKDNSVDIDKATKLFTAIIDSICYD